MCQICARNVNTIIYDLFKDIINRQDYVGISWMVELLNEQ
jgi:hypothetical protein